MVDVEPVSPPSGSRISLESASASHDSRVEHEAADVPDRDPVDNAVDDVFTAEPGSVGPKAAPAPASSKDNKPPASKATSSTPKKPSASATLPGVATTVKAGKAAAASPSSPLSKTSTSSSAKKPTTTSSSTKTATMTSRGSGPAPPSRRSSMLPPRAPSATGAPPPKTRTSTLLASLTSSASSRPPPSEANVRPSVVSPAGSVSSLKPGAAAGAALPATTASAPRPRAAVSDAVKRTPSSSRQTLPPAAVQPSPRPQMRPIGSIASIKELRDDAKPTEELQEKLRVANEKLSAKSEEVATLEAKIVELEASLGEAIVNVRTKTTSIEQLQISKQSSDADMKDLKIRLQQVQADHSRDLAVLNSVRGELDSANEAIASQAENVGTLEAQIDTLRADIVAAQENFESLRASSDQSSAAAAAAAQMEREAFLRAKADIETITAEVNTSRAARDKAINDAAAKSSESQQRTAEVVALTARIDELTAVREENAAKISELEIEILELKESQESAEDERKETLDRIRKLEIELEMAVATTERVLREAEARDTESTQAAADAALRYADELQLVKSDLAKAASETESLRTDLAAAHAAHEDTKAAAYASAETHEQEMEEAEQSYLSKHIELSEEIKRLTAELEAEEAKYNAKLDALRTEHDQLLEETFERAKNEAGDVHGQDLQALRAESQATIEQLRAAHQSTIDELRTEHEAAFESQANAVEKKLNNQALELRATQEDLSKAKTALDASRAESESLRGQLDDARAGLMAVSANSDQVVEIERLTRELSSLRDENVMLNDVMAVTKESLSEMSTNHSKELEEAARIRVEEVMRLRTIHDGELSTLAAQKSELALSLSDLQGEIAVLKAQLAAVEPVAMARNSGAVHAPATNVTRDELQKAHEAHNLKMHDLHAEHERVVRGLRVEVETLQARLDEVQQDVARKSMEIQYLEQEQEESQDSITRLKADLEALNSAAP